MKYRKLLRVNLTTGAINEEDIPPLTVANFIGGRGFGVNYLYNELKPGTDPLGPENKLIFSIGPLAGTGAPSSSRWIVTAKSPLTGTYFRGCGGADFGAWMRFVELDMIIVEGKTESPVYLYIENGHYEIKNGKNLWGKNTVETEQAIKEIHGPKATSACIGPSGERLIRYATIAVDRGHCAGRGGMGTVMASKNLKAIAINPTGGVKAPSKDFKALIARELAEFQRFIRGEPGSPPFSEKGTTGGVDGTNILGVYPVRNFREGSLDEWKKISSDEYLALKVKSVSCYGCPVHCDREVRVKSGPYAGVSTKGLEYETIWAFTGCIGSNDIGFPVAADLLCDELGIDTISAGVSMGFAYELFEKGIITKKDTDGLELVWGNHEAAFELLKKIANRQGLGDILAEGVKRASAYFGRGSEDYAMHIKGLEMPAFDVRGVKWHGLAMATCPCGAFHNMAFSTQELFGNPWPRSVDRFAEEGYADINKINEDWTAVVDTGIWCNFIGEWQVPSLNLLRELLPAVTGVPQFADEKTIFQVGERITNLERAFNVREGFDRKDDIYPKRFTTELLKKAGPSEGSIIGNFGKMLDEYYAIRGWDQNGIPTIEKLESLGLGQIAKDIIKQRK